MSEQRDERLDRWLAEEARSGYNPPPTTPSEAMWERIEAERRRTAVVPIGSRAWVRWGLGLAAALAIGIGLGRWTRDEAPTPVATAPDAVDSPLPTAERSGDTGRDAPESAASPSSGAEIATAGTGDVAPPVPNRGQRRAARREVPPATAIAPRSDRGSAPVYRSAALRMLGRAETLLAAYREDRRYGRVDPAIDHWARQTLSSTRLLIDSPAGDDPELQPLLEDLELVLAQIVQLSGAPAEAHEEVDRLLEERELIPRLSNVVPGGSILTRS